MLIIREYQNKIGGAMKKKFNKNLVAVIAVLLLVIGSLGSYVYFSSRSKTTPNDELDKTGTGSISENTGDVSDNTNQKETTTQPNDTNPGTQDTENANDNNVPDDNTNPDKDISNENTDDNNNNHSNNNSENINNNIYGPKINKPEAVKAIYLTGWSAGSKEKLESLISIAQNTEINSFVVDIKDDDGLVSYASNIPAVREINAFSHKYNIDKLIPKLHDNGIYVIGRLVCFKDPVLSSKRPDLAVKNTSGGLWKDNFKMTWLDPYNKTSWPYLIEIAKEALTKGFDEIQFDYVRFPNDGDKKAMVFNTTDKKKYEVINEFLAYAKSELPGAIISADVFGIICESPKDTEDIGQYLELIGKDIEYISPMVYPSHYAFGQIVNKVAFQKPDLDPYGVVYNSLVKAKNRISAVEEYKADVRPYLQGFTASWLRSGNYQTYGAKQIREQIKAVYDAGYTEWIIWDPANKYPIEAFEKEQ